MQHRGDRRAGRKRDERLGARGLDARELRVDADIGESVVFVGDERHPGAGKFRLLDQALQDRVGVLSRRIGAVEDGDLLQPARQQIAQRHGQDVVG